MAEEEARAERALRGRNPLEAPPAYCAPATREEAKIVHFRNAEEQLAFSLFPNEPRVLTIDGAVSDAIQLARGW